MAYSHTRAQYEAALARAHRAMFKAEQLADELRNEGGAYDCRMIAREIYRLADDSLTEKPRPAPKVDDDRAYL